jgi:hypothetical protein
MKLFACVCEQLLFFESVECIRCNRCLAFLPDRGAVEAMEQESGSDETLWRPAREMPEASRYRPCRNYREHGVCNWAVPAGEPEEYCRACRLNQTIPDLAEPGAKEAWHRLEIAKRRLVYTLLDLALPLDGKSDDLDRGLAFSFLKDDPSASVKVSTGHSEGVITINVAEADAPFRERMRVRMGETYRTLLGHFRHEIGHYYWQRLIAGGPRLGRFRERFGDERADYAAAQQRHYDAGPPADWQDQFVSAYASMHPWEDWAETWAHYLHMVDTLETARSFGVALRPRSASDVPSQPAVAVRRLDLHSFDHLVTGWLPLTIALNSLNRSMGLPDPYPFVLAGPAVEKLRFVHDVIADESRACC